MKSTGSRAPFNLASKTSPFPKKSPGPIPPWESAFALGTGLFLVNVGLLSPFIGWYDSGEFLAATVALGISHPSGQVLYHLLGKLFLLWPAGNPIFRLGLLSVFSSSVASGLFFLLACRLAECFSPRPAEPISRTLKTWLALLTLAWSFSLPWWTYSLTVVVYTLHVALILGAIWLVSLQNRKKWLAAALVLGAAVVFRPTQYFGLAVLSAVYFWESRGTKIPQGREIPRILAFFLLGFSTALYLPLRSALHPAIVFSSIDHAPDLIRQVLALKFSKSLGSTSFSNETLILGQLFQRLWRDLTPIGFFLLAGGFWTLWKKKEKIPPFFWAASGWALLEAALVVTVPYPAFESHQFLYPWVFSGLLASLFLAWISHWEFKRIGRARGRETIAWKEGMGFLLLLWVLLQFGLVGRQWDRAHERGAQDFARNVLEILGPHAIYVPAEENQYFPVVGYQVSTGLRPDVEILEPGKEGHDIVGQKMRDALVQGRPLYLNRSIEGLPPNWYFKAEGPLLKATQEPPAFVRPAPPHARPLAAWGALQLMAVETSATTVAAGGRLTLNYQWARTRPSEADRSEWVTVYFVDDQGAYPLKQGLLWLHDIHEPFNGRLPWSGLHRGFWYGEERVLFVPSDFPPGHYRIVVGLQKPGEAPRTGREPFTGDFYDRAESQDLAKFTGEPGGDFFVQYAPETSGNLPSAFIPLTFSQTPADNLPFAPVGEIEITAPAP
jgi:Protein of unknown function (DUF2723)